MEGADCVPSPEVALQRLQESAKPLRSTFCERNYPGELRDFALTGADTAGVLRPSRRCQLSFEIGQTLLQRDSAQFGRVSVKLTQLLNLLVDEPVPL